MYTSTTTESKFHQFVSKHRVSYDGLFRLLGLIILGKSYMNANNVIEAYIAHLLPVIFGGNV